MFAFVIYDGRRQELFAARDRLGKKPFFYTVLDGIFHFASELPALAQSPRWQRRRRSDRARRLSLARIFRRARHDLPRTCQAAAGPLAAHCRRARRDAPVLGRPRSSTPTIGPTDELIEDIDATLRQAVTRSAGKRSAARGVSQRRHRFRPGGVVHGRGTRRSAGDRVGRLWRRRDTTSSKPRASRRAHFHSQHHAEDHRAAARRSDRPGDEPPRRAACRFVRDSDMVCLARRAAST